MTAYYYVQVYHMRAISIHKFFSVKIIAPPPPLWHPLTFKLDGITAIWLAQLVTGAEFKFRKQQKVLQIF